MQPLETTNFMILGLAFIFGPILLHVFSLYWRFRNLNAEREMLDEA